MRALARGGFTYGEYCTAVAARRTGRGPRPGVAGATLPDRWLQRGIPGRHPHREAHADAGDRGRGGRGPRATRRSRTGSRSSRRWSLPQHKVWPLLQEVELAFQATIDPYVRGDVFLTFSPEGVEVEEAYFTTLSLPWGLEVKAGKIYSPFGRTSQLHRHQWTFVDQPALDAAARRRGGARGRRAATSPGSRRCPGSRSCTWPTRRPLPASTRRAAAHRRGPAHPVLRPLRLGHARRRALLGAVPGRGSGAVEEPGRGGPLREVPRPRIPLLGGPAGGDLRTATGRAGLLGGALGRVRAGRLAHRPELGGGWPLRQRPGPRGLAGGTQETWTALGSLLHERVLPAPDRSPRWCCCRRGRPASRAFSASSSPSAPTRRTRSRRRP